MIKIYSFRNRKTSSYSDPFVNKFDTNDYKKELIRSIILNQDEAIKNHFDEMELYLLGNFDDDTGKINVLPEPEFVEDLGQYVQRNKNN